MIFKVVIAMIVGFILGTIVMYHGIDTAGTIVVDTKHVESDVFRLEVNTFDILTDPKNKVVKFFIKHDD